MLIGTHSVIPHLLAILRLHIFFKCVQTIPTGSPPVLTPSLHKQDIEQMRKDLPKYDDTGVFTPEVKKEWEDFLGTFNDRFGKVPFEEPPWVLDEIRELIAKRPCSPPPVPPVLPEKVKKKASSLAKCHEVRENKYCLM